MIVCDIDCLVYETFFFDRMKLFFYIYEINDYFLVLLMLFVIQIDDNSFGFFCIFSFGWAHVTLPKSIKLAFNDTKYLMVYKIEYTSSNKSLPHLSS
jgi:hypothetical protein